VAIGVIRAPIPRSGARDDGVGARMSRTRVRFREMRA